MQLEINSARLEEELEQLASYSDVPAPVVTRVVYSPADRAARLYVKQLFTAAGLVVREDGVGNTFARWAGADASLPAIGTGSHIDAIPNAGKYDGTVGVLGALEAIRALRRAGVEPRRSIELLMFTAEEPTRFGIGCPGSRLLAGVLDAAAGTHLRDAEGRSLEELRTLAGFHGPLSNVALPRGYYDAFVELHIEQGPLLERNQIALGVVTSIAAPASLYVTIKGEGGHAGGVLMPDRRDAFCAAAELALEVETAVKSTGAIDTVATIGICDVFPGAVNSIPSRVRLSLDVRDTDQARRDGVLESIRKSCHTIAERRGVQIQPDLLNSDAPAICDAKLVETLARACRTHGLSYQRMVSRAYHDSLFMARIVPVAMLFIPCRGGVSHRPDEYASPEAIANGTLVLAETLAELAG